MNRHNDFKNDKFQHYLITRFNLRGTVKSNINSKDDSEWMRYRLEIFKKYCYASVLKQKNQKFTWLVFLDETTEQKFITEISKLADRYKNLRPIYVAGIEDFLPVLQTEIKNNNNCEFLITSRLDNDDCLHQDYIDEVQQQFNSQKYLALNFINGMTLELINGYKCGYRIHANNPFSSLIEKNENIDTIYCRRHGDWGKVRLVKQINNKTPLWLSLSHGSNIFNRYIGFGRIKKPTLREFNIEPKILNEITNQLVENKLFSSISNMLAANIHYYLKISRHKLRTALKVIPDR